MKKFFLHTMGCKSNQFEGELIEQKLIEAGLTRTENLLEADYYILNSCSVTHKSDNEAMYLIRNAKHKNPNLITVITGCIAQTEKEELLEKDYIDCILGNNDKFKIADILENLSPNKQLCIASDIMHLTEFNEQPLIDTQKTRASLKIQDGCDSRCAYCIIPYARGKSRSASPEFIIKQIKKLEDKGFHEVVFTGIHIGQWGKEWNLELLDLLKSVESDTDIHRYRLGSLNPTEITDELLDFLSKSQKFCPHFHLSLQSACNETLRSMNRFYTVEKYLEQIKKINSLFNMPFLGSDIIAGFAGETDTDFQTTVSNLKKSDLTQIHTFPYSIRKGTKGSLIPNQIDEKTKEERTQIIKQISADKYHNFLKKNIGYTREILVEKNPDKHNNMLKGVTDNYLTVHLSTDNKVFKNTIQKVYIKEITDNKLYGDIV